MIEDWKADLLKEQSLSQVFYASRSLRKSKANRYVYQVAFIVLGALSAFWVYNGDISGSSAAVYKVSDIVFNLTVQVLGFLIGGFAIFATISNPKLMIGLSRSKIEEQNISVFKSIFFNFLSVFVIYIISLSISVFYKLFDASGLSDISISYFGDINFILLPSINSASFSILVFALIMAIVRIKSFIWNIYQCLITMLIAGDIISESEG